jgi:uncharacterized protein (TIGR00297 family)
MAQETAVPKGEWNARNDSIGLLTAGCLLVWFLLVNRSPLVMFPYPQGPYDYLAPAITGLFALAGWAVRGVSVSGALSGWAIAFLIYAAGGWRAFLVLFVVFALTWIATRLGRSTKEKLRLAERKTGRGANQVVANLGVAGACSVLVLMAPYLGVDYEQSFIAALVAALCEPAADTVSSEIGKAFATQARLITNFSVVTPGTDGGISIVGTSSGIVAGIIVGGVTYLVAPHALRSIGIGTGAGILGMFIDSLLGATLERRGYLNNDRVNLLGTASAAGLAYLLSTIR